MAIPCIISEIKRNHDFTILPGGGGLAPQSSAVWPGLQIAMAINGKTQSPAVTPTSSYSRGPNYDHTLYHIRDKAKSRFYGELLSARQTMQGLVAMSSKTRLRSYDITLCWGNGRVTVCVCVTRPQTRLARVTRACMSVTVGCFVSAAVHVNQERQCNLM